VGRSGQTCGRLTQLSDDSAYDGKAILERFQAQCRVPVVALHPRRATKRPPEVPNVRPPKLMLEMDWAKQERYVERMLIERVNAMVEGGIRGTGHTSAGRSEGHGALPVRNHRANI
jgi:hypothetical protein